MRISDWSSDGCSSDLLLRFGRIVEPDVKPGLHMKIPYVNSVRKFDARLLTLDTTTSRFLTLEKKALMVDSYAKWRVDDAERFYTATSGMKQIADERLARSEEHTSELQSLMRI